MSHPLASTNNSVNHIPIPCHIQSVNWKWIWTELTLCVKYWHNVPDKQILSLKMAHNSSEICTASLLIGSRGNPQVFVILIFSNNNKTCNSNEGYKRNHSTFSIWTSFHVLRRKTKVWVFNNNKLKLLDNKINISTQNISTEHQNKQNKQ